MSIPSISGLPAWAAILVTALICLTTLGVAVFGYMNKPNKPSEPIAQILGAQIADMGAIRHLSEVCIQLIGAINRLDDRIGDLIHHQRDQNELLRENNTRLRELRERFDGGPRH